MKVQKIHVDMEFSQQWHHNLRFWLATKSDLRVNETAPLSLPLSMLRVDNQKQELLLDYLRIEKSETFTRKEYIA